MVELLVVIAIIGILVAILLPAVQASREAARKTQCKNHLKQMGLAFLHHEQAQGFLPSSGWGYRWVGDPDGGFGSTQPGGWAYSILPYMEEQALYDAGNRLRDVLAENDLNFENDPPEGAVTQTLATTVVPTFNCPSKRPARLFPMHSIHGTLAHNLPACNAHRQCRVARGDYRVNSGNVNSGDLAGPSLSAAEPLYPVLHAQRMQNGISHERSTVRIQEVTDGASKTLMVGEKYQDPLDYETGRDHADNQCVYSGHDSDNNGYTGNQGAELRPRRDTPGIKRQHHFGSAHVAGLHVAYCDGSIHFVGYDIAGPLWFVLGGRNDEEGR